MTARRLLPIRGGVCKFLAVMVGTLCLGWLVGIFRCSNTTCSPSSVPLTETLILTNANRGRIRMPVFLRPRPDLCLDGTTVSSARYASQNGEDRYTLSHFFANITAGVYVEVGALDGVTYSNTLFYEKCLGWSGLLIEATSTFHQLRKNRPLSRTVNVAVCNESRMVDFVGQSNVAGRPQLFSQRFINDQHRGRLSASYKVQCLPLGTLLRDAGITMIDFFTLDVEGGEYEALQVSPHSCACACAYPYPGNGLEHTSLGLVH
jgi:FkbM family methyltransferase